MDIPPKYSIQEQYLRFLFTFRTLVDLGIILPFYIFLDGSLDNSSVLNRVNLLKVFRVFRIFRLLSISALFKELDYVKLMFVETLYASRRVLFILVVTGYFTLAFFGILFFFLEKGTFSVSETYPQGAYYVNNPVQGTVPSIYTSAPVGMYFIAQTLTTDTYGDIYPTNAVGRALVVFLMYFGVIFVSLPIGLLSNEFRNRYKRFFEKQELELQERMFIQDPGVSADERNRRKQELIKLYRRNLLKERTLHTHSRKEILRKLVERYVAREEASPRAKELLLRMNPRTPFEQSPVERPAYETGYEVTPIQGPSRVLFPINESAMRALNEPDAVEISRDSREPVESKFEPLASDHTELVEMGTSKPIPDQAPMELEGAEMTGVIKQDQDTTERIIEKNTSESYLSSLGSYIHSLIGLHDSIQKSNIAARPEDAEKSVSPESAAIVVNLEPSVVDPSLALNTSSSVDNANNCSSVVIHDVPNAEECAPVSQQISNHTLTESESQQYNLEEPETSVQLDSAWSSYRIASFRDSIRSYEEESGDDTFNRLVSDELIGISNIEVRIDSDELVIPDTTKALSPPAAKIGSQKKSSKYLQPDSKKGLSRGHPSTESLPDSDLSPTEQATVNGDLLGIFAGIIAEYKAILTIHPCKPWDESTSIAEKLFDFFDYNLFKNVPCTIGAIITYGAVLMGSVSYLFASVWTFQEPPNTCANPVCVNVTGLCEGQTICQPVPFQAFNTVAIVSAAILSVEMAVRFFTCWAVEEQRNHVKPYLKPDSQGDHFTVMPQYPIAPRKRTVRAALDRTNSAFNNFTAAMSNNVFFPMNPRYSVIEFYLRYVFSVRSMVAVAATIPTLIFFSRPYNNAQYYETWGGIFSMLCIVKIFFCSKELSWFFSLVMKTLYNARHALFLLVIINVIAAVFLGSLVYEAERGTFTVNESYPSGSFLTMSSNQLSMQPSVYTDLLVGFYTAFCTLTTVTYGETAPTTGFGRAICVIIMFTGLILLAMPIGIIGTSFTSVYERDNKKRALKAKMNQH